MRQIPKIAYLLTSLADGGSERNVLNLCLFEKKKIFKPEIVTCTSNYDFAHEYTKKERDQIVIHHLLQTEKKIPKYSLLLLFKLFYRLFLLIRKQKYAVLIGAVEIYPYYIAILYAIICNTKSILIVGNNLSEELRTTYSYSKLFHKILLFLAFRITNKVICVSFGVKEDLVKNFFVPRKKIIVITNGIDRQKIVSLSQKKGRVILKKKD
jgi:glycosyltransferase involved in cell wall biosynthesis